MKRGSGAVGRRGSSVLFRFSSLELGQVGSGFQDSPGVVTGGLARLALRQHECRVVGLGGIGRIGHRITTASLHDRLESLDGRPKIGQLIIVFISGVMLSAVNFPVGE